FGSLIRGFLDQRKKREEMKRKYPPKPGAKPWAFFNTFRRGMQDLPNGMADAVGRERIITGIAATIIERSADGWRVTLENGDIIEGDALIIATEAWTATRLVRDVDESIAGLLGEIPCSSSATVSMAFRSEDCPFDVKWFGILSPVVEDRPLLAVTLSSSKWPDRAPEGRVLLRGFIGGPQNQHLLDAPDEELVETIRQQLVELLKVRPEATPIFTRVFRWNGGMPQYTIGHLDRVDEIERKTGEISGFGLAGGAFRGVGIPNCIESGERAVDKVLGDLGVTYVEETAPPRGR
ncbi:MAG: protoporphyrinogen oxidase, partial [Coriobacteriia bacterium]|nr:protoporphyrinogen oxidase [Coriobacteriia bacterium]